MLLRPLHCSQARTQGSLHSGPGTYDATANRSPWKPGLAGTLQSSASPPYAAALTQDEATEAVPVLPPKYSALHWPIFAGAQLCCPPMPIPTQTQLVHPVQGGADAEALVRACFRRRSPIPGLQTLAGLRQLARLLRTPSQEVSESQLRENCFQGDTGHRRSTGGERQLKISQPEHTQTLN